MFKTINKLTMILIAGATMLGLSSCDIEPKDRFEELGEVKAARAVLLMDFTGQNCVNCPDAHEVMDGLVNQYGSDHLIPVSIHAGQMAVSTDVTNFGKNFIGLMIKEGNEINDAFSITTWPMGAVDRINDPGAALNFMSWSDAVRTAIETPTDVDIKATATLQDDNIVVDTRAICKSNRNAALQVWVVEDGIVAFQKLKTGRDPNYVHNHVLRYVQYPVKSGKTLSMSANVWNDDQCTIQIKNTDKERWNKENLSVVAFVFEGTRILNTVKVPVTTEATE